MFLGKLNDEQKDLFLDLCIYAANANEDFAAEEKDCIMQYCKEMQIAEPRFEAVRKSDEIISRIVEISSPSEIRMITLELTALILSDKKYDDMEQKFMNEFVLKTGITAEEHKKMVSILNQLTGLYDEIKRIVQI